MSQTDKHTDRQRENYTPNKHSLQGAIITDTTLHSLTWATAWKVALLAQILKKNNNNRFLKKKYQFCLSWLLKSLKSLPVHSFNALIIPILRGCLQSLFNIPVPWYLFDTVLKVISWPAFVSRCIIDAYFSFYGLVLDIDMNCGCRLYRSFCQMDLTYAMDCLLNSITGMNVAFLLTVSDLTHNYDYHKQIKNNFNSP